MGHAGIISDSKEVIKSKETFFKEPLKGRRIDRNLIKKKEEGLAILKIADADPQERNVQVAAQSRELDECLQKKLMRYCHLVQRNYHCKKELL